MEKIAQENLEALSGEDLEAVSGGRWVYLSQSSSTRCTSDGTRCGSQEVVERYWID